MEAGLNEGIANGSAPAPELTVVVPSRDRVARLSVLLDSLAEQIESAETWDVVVVHDSDDRTEELLRTHKLAIEGRLRYRRLALGTGSSRGSATSGGEVRAHFAWRSLTMSAVSIVTGSSTCWPSPGAIPNT